MARWKKVRRAAKADMTHSTVNIPWKTRGVGDAEYVYAFQQVVMPVAAEFDPTIVIGK